MARHGNFDGDQDGSDPAPVAMGYWFESLADFKAKAVLVLGPDPSGPNDQRQVVAVYPQAYVTEAASLAGSHAFGVSWRASQAPLVAWRNLAGPHGDQESWISGWLQRGALSMVRVDFQTAFGQGFECFIFCGGEFSNADEAKRIAYTAMSAWPLIKAEVVANRYEVTPREMEVLLALAEGLTAREAGERVGLAERTIGFHLSSLMEKLHASNKAAVVQRACCLGLL